MNLILIVARSDLPGDEVRYSVRALGRGREEETTPGREVNTLTFTSLLNSTEAYSLQERIRIHPSNGVDNFTPRSKRRVFYALLLETSQARDIFSVVGALVPGAAMAYVLDKWIGNSQGGENLTPVLIPAETDGPSWAEIILKWMRGMDGVRDAIAFVEERV